MVYKCFIVLLLTSTLQIALQQGPFLRIYQPKMGAPEGDVSILDAQTFQISNFRYLRDFTDDGITMPDYYPTAGWFVVGNDPIKFRDQYVDLPYLAVLTNHKGECKPIMEVGAEDKTVSFQLTLPDNLTMNNLTYLALYSIRFQHNLASVPLNGYNGNQISKPSPPSCSTLMEGTVYHTPDYYDTWWPRAR